MPRRTSEEFPEHISVAPPTPRQLEEMRKRLLQCQFVETAAALVGIPRKILTVWVQLGRAGRPEFVPFVEMIDNASSELAAQLIAPIQKAALEEGNLKAAQWLYQVRCKDREARFGARLAKIEEAAEDAFVEAQIGTGESEEDIAAAEARLAASQDEVKH